MYSVSAVIVLFWICVSGSLAASLTYTMDEEEPSGYLVGNLKQDSDLLTGIPESVQDQLRFRLLPGLHKAYFRVDEVSGSLYVQRPLDRDSLEGCSSRCVVSLEAAIFQPVQYFQVLLLEINLLDINDNSPTFSKDQFSVSVSESVPPGTRLMLATASDPDSVPNAIQDYYLRVQHPLFKLELSTGSSTPGSGSGLYLVTQNSLDHESQRSYELEVVARDGGTPSNTGTLAVTVTVVDTNDNRPVFDQTEYSVTILENQDLYETIVTVHAEDIDHGLNGQVLYGLSQQTRDQYDTTYGINNRTGELYLKRPLVYLGGSCHQLVVVGRDQGADSQQSHATVTVCVTDINDHLPEITVTGVIPGQEIGVQENAPPGSIVAVISVRDQDPGDNGRCTCEILDSNFELQELYTNGFKVVSRQRFDREVQAQYQSVVQCRDGGSPSLSSQTQVTIHVHDVNDRPPQFEVPSYQVSIKENTTAGSSLLQVIATDRDQPGTNNSKVTYSLERSAQRHLAINPETGVISLKSQLDYETAAFVEYQILAQDGGTPALTAKTIVRIDVLDVNDEAPVFRDLSYNFGTYENQANVTEVGTVTATDKDSPPYNSFAYSLYGDSDILHMFNINSANGRISTRHSLDREIKSVYHLVVMATNIYPPQQSASVSVTIHVADKNDNVPKISFPGDQNDSVQVSAYSPVNYVFSRVVAHDVDLGKNAKLSYELISDYGLFRIDPLLGHLYVKASLRDVTESGVDLPVVVRDGGNPSLATSATLRVEFNITRTFAEGMGLLPDQGSDGLTNHQRILVILGAVTTILVALLVVAIVLVKRRQVRHSKEAFRCLQRVDFSQKMDSQAPVAPPMKDTGMLEAGSVISDSSSLWLNKVGGGEAGYRDMYGEGSRTDVYRDNNPGYFHTTNQAALPKINNSNHGNRPVSCDFLNPQAPSRLSSFAARSHHELDSDTASRCSAEVSNTDSGHGPSEEGDDPHLTQSGAKPRQCPVHGSTDAGSIQSYPGAGSSQGYPGADLRTKLPHLQRGPDAPKRQPSLTSHEHGLSAPGVHGHMQSKRGPKQLSATGPESVPHSERIPIMVPHPEKTPFTDPPPAYNDLNKLSTKPPHRPPKPSRPLSYRPPPTDLWINSKHQPTAISTGTGSGQKPYLSGSSTQVTRQDPGEDSSDDDTASSASSGSFVLNISDIKSVDV